MPDDGPFAEAIKRQRIVDNNIESEKNKVENQFIPPPNIVVRKGEDDVFFPNYSGIKQGALKSSSTTFLETETDPVFLSLSGSFVTSESDPIWLSMSGSYAKLASPTFTGTVTIPTPFTLGATSVTPTGTELNYVDGVTSAIQTQLNAKIQNNDNFSGSFISGSAIVTTEDHTVSGSAHIVGIITHTSATPPTASTYPQGTLYIQYTA